MLAHLLRRCPSRYDRNPNRQPQDEDPWEWYCGFYPGSHPGEHQNGTAATFEEARADFESAWQVFLSKRTEADFQAYSLWDAGKRL
jgi:hypothetical protein